MIKKKIVVQMSGGLEARPTALLVQTASQFESTIYIESNEKKVNAKSIMGMLTLGISQGEEVIVHADGIDEEEALGKMEDYLRGR